MRVFADSRTILSPRLPVVGKEKKGAEVVLKHNLKCFISGMETSET